MADYLGALLERAKSVPGNTVQGVSNMGSNFNRGLQVIGDPVANPLLRAIGDWTKQVDQATPPDENVARKLGIIK